MNTSLQLKNMPVEFINIVALNPLVSSCDIKVMYSGPNRNQSYFTKPVAEAMAASLPNIPIVGEFLEECGDFGDHGQEMVINAKGVKYIKRTMPYGVVPADTKIAWQKFIDDDGVERDYLMCQGFLWTGRYPESERILERGNGQSMELHSDSLKGNWAIPPNEVDEYFIVDEAVFSALCILGEDVEPCFEGANVTAPTNILEHIDNQDYSLKKNEFKEGMTQFMLDLKEALNSEEGGEKMKDKNGQEIENPIDTNANANAGADFVKDPKEMTPEEKAKAEKEAADNAVDPKKVEEDKAKAEADAKAKADAEKKAKEDAANNAFVDPKEKAKEEEAKKLEAEKAAKTKDSAKVPEDGEDPKNPKDPKKEDPKDGQPKYTLEEVVEYTELKTKYDALEAEVFSLREMKTSIDTSSKETMIKSFFMLDAEDLKDVKENIASYSLSEIESKLSVIAVRKKVNFNLGDSTKTDNHLEDPIISFNAKATDNTPSWLKAVDTIVKNRI